MNWNLFIKALEEIEGNPHRVMPACPTERIKWVEARWGNLPHTICSMLCLFNGAELFIDGVPMLTLLGVSTDPPQPPLLWPNQCCMDHWLTSWRLTGEPGWPIARTNYGSLWIFDHDNMQEWDSTRGNRLGDSRPFSPWIHEIMEDGKNYMAQR